MQALKNLVNLYISWINEHTVINKFIEKNSRLIKNGKLKFYSIRSCVSIKKRNDF
jgi:hypothetical protein